MNLNFQKLNQSIIKCRKCPRLVKFRKKISVEKRKQYENEIYWGKPITGFGDTKGKILFVGLAPAAHGGTRTGRVFTGDKSSDFLSFVWYIYFEIFYVVQQQCILYLDVCLLCPCQI